MSSVRAWGYSIAILIIVLSILYGCYWVTKTISYKIFYEDMVIETITETINSKYLQKDLRFGE